jgi:LysM repeat protein
LEDDRSPIRISNLNYKRGDLTVHGKINAIHGLSDLDSSMRVKTTARHHLKTLFRYLLVILFSAGLIARDPEPVVNAQGPCGDTYIVQTGDTLSEIAELCGTTVDAIMNLNPEISDPGQIFAGQILRIPRVEDFAGPIVAITPECGFPGTTITIFGSGFPEETPVQVRAGPLNQLAIVTAATTSDELGMIDTTITIPASIEQEATWVIVAEARVSSAVFTGTANDFNLVGNVPDPNSPTIYEAQAGDDLNLVAIKFNRDLEDILRVNPGISETAALIPGQIISIPARERGYPQTTVFPVCGPPETIATFSGRGFPPGAQLKLTTGVYLGEYQELPDVQVNPDRTVNTLFTIPNSAQPGEHRVVMSASLTVPPLRSSSNLFSVTPRRDPNKQSLYFVQPGDTLNDISEATRRSVSSILSVNPQITNPNQLELGKKLVIPPQIASINITPSSGPPGTQVQAVGLGFPASSSITLGISRLNDPFDIVGTIPVDELGIFRTPVLIPLDASPGERWVIAALRFTASGTQALVTSNEFTITRTVLPVNPQVSIWPVSGRPGTVIHVVVSNFPSRTQVNYFLGKSEADLELIGTTWTEINGTFAAQIQIPNRAQTGENWIVVVETVEEPIVQASSTGFTVTESGAAAAASNGIYSNVEILVNGSPLAGLQSGQ